MSLNSSDILAGVGDGLSQTPASVPTTVSDNNVQSQSPAETEDTTAADLAALGKSTPGQLSIDITSPAGLVGSAQESAHQGSEFLGGLWQAVFGSSQATVGGDHGGILGGVPVVSDVARAAGEAAANVIGGAANVAGSVAENLPNPFGAQNYASLAQQFASLPDSPEKEEAIKQLEGGGPFHLGSAQAMWNAIQAQENASLNEQKDGSWQTLYPEWANGSAPTLAGFVNQLLNMPFQRPVERLIAGFGSFGPNRLQQAIENVKNGTANPAEAVAAQQYTSGAWTADHALDFMAASHTGLSHEGWQELIGSMLTDPSTIISAGAGLGAHAIGLAGEAARAGEGAAFAGKLGGVRTAMAAIGRVLEPAQRAMVTSSMGRVANIVKAGLDPIGAFMGPVAEGAGNIGRAVSEAAGAERLAHLAVDATTGYVEAVGPQNYTSVLDKLAAVDPELVPELEHGLGVGIQNATAEARGEIMGQHFSQTLGRAENAGRALVSGTGTPRQLAESLPAPMHMRQVMAEETLRTMRVVGRTGAEHDVVVSQISRRLTQLWGHDEAFWTEFLSQMNPKELAIMHMFSYGEADAAFQGVRDGVVSTLGDVPVSGKGSAPISHLTLVSDTRATLADMKALAKNLAGRDIAKQKKALEQAYDTFDEIRRGVHLPKGDQPILPAHIGAARAYVQRLIDSGSLVRRITDKEWDGLPQEIKDEVPKDGPWRLGFMPDIDKRWGFVDDDEGVPTYLNPYIEHTSDAYPGFRGAPVSDFARNLAGSRLGFLTPATKPISWLQMGLNMMRSDVSGRMTALSARNRFVSHMDEVGFEPGLANDIWNALNTHTVLLHAPTMTAMTGQQMWDAAAELVPPERRLEFGPRGLMEAVLIANEGDLSMVGASMKLSGFMKRTLADAHIPTTGVRRIPVARRLAGAGGPTIEGGNTLGSLSANAWNMLRYVYRPEMWMWSAVEQFILAPMRGVSGIFRVGETLSPEDIAMSNLLDRAQKTGMVAAATKAEWAQGTAFGAIAAGEEGLRELQERIGTAAAQSLAGVHTLRRIEYLRVIQDDLGKGMRKIVPPQDFDALAQHYADLAEAATGVRPALNDGQVALRWYSEQMGVNDSLFVRPEGESLDFSDIYREANWHQPRSFGEVQGLELDRMSRRVMGMPLDALRKALRRRETTSDRVSAAIIEQGYHPDYARRVQNALDFSPKQFYDELRRGYGGMSKDQVQFARTLLDGMAAARGMTPTDFLSQVFAPNVARTGNLTDSLLGDWANTVTQLSVDGRGNYGQFLNAMAHVFGRALDDSGKAVVMRAVRGLKPDAAVDVTTWSKREENALGRLMEAYAKDTLPKGASPNLVRILQGFGRFTEHTSPALRKLPALSDDAKRVIGDLLGVPREDAIFADHAHVTTFNSMMSVMREAEDDAFRLMYYSRNRTLLSRSLNHPFFGIYPASYMFGKMLPELARFLMVQPFGIRTSALAYGLNDMRQTLAVQMESDPEFVQQVQQAGGDPLLTLLFLSLPASPFDLPAGMPSYLGVAAKYGMVAHQAILNGQTPPSLNWKSIGDSVITYMNTPQKTLNLATRTFGELGDIAGNVTSALSPDNKQEAESMSALARFAQGLPLSGGLLTPQVGAAPGPEVGPFHGAQLQSELSTQAANIMAALQGRPEPGS